MNKWEILSVGGSLVCPKDLDLHFLREFRDFILNWVRKGKRFVIVVGGGALAREYQKAARQFKVSPQNLDWIGIFATWFNASLVKSLFEKLAYPKVITNPKKRIIPNKKIIVAGGWKPGWSTDFDAVILAKNFKAERVINLSNIDCVFDKDPKKFDDAKPILRISFRDFLKITGKRWIPGGNFPFDPMAAQLARKFGIKIIVLNGKNFKNLSRLFEGRSFLGTVIS